MPRVTGAVVALGLAVLAPVAARAQVIGDVERQLLADRAGALAGVEPAFWNALAALRREEDRQRALKADISFGLSGDESGPRSLFRLNTGIALTRGDFPSEVTVVSRLGLQVRDGQLQEDVTSLLLSYDYHTTSHVEYFAFAERFSDSFLSIQQRYEIGFGARTGWHLGHVTGWEPLRASINTVRAGLDRVRTLQPTPVRTREGGSILDADQAAGLPSALDRLEHAVHDQSSRVFLGVVASVFAELERAEIEVTSRPTGSAGESTTSSFKVPIDATQRYRLTVRPAIQLRPIDEITIVVYPYFKLPLDGQRRVSMPDGSRRLDYRRDVFSEMNWAIRQEQTGLESVGFVVTVNHHFDNVPPAVPGDVIADAAAAGRVLSRTSAESGHRFVSMGLKLRW
jgi:hypothetical protein